MPRVGLNVHIYPSAFEYESRILKVTKTLVDHAFVEHVLVIATAKDNLPERQTIDNTREVLRVGTHLVGKCFVSKVFRFVEWSIRVGLKLRHEAPGMVNCHSLSVLPLCVVLKWWHRCILVYEPHELETETVTSIGIRKRIEKWVERKLIGQADRVIVVSGSIADHYRQDYQLPDVPVVLNVPERLEDKPATPNKLLRNQFGIPDDHLVFMYQGIFDVARGVKLLLDVFRAVPLDRHLIFLGFGPLIDEVKACALNRPNIHFYPAVSPNEIMKFTRGADVGICILTSNCLSYRYSLSNKIFHYLHAGIPILVSDHLVDTGQLLERYNCGWRVDNESCAIVESISSIDPKAIKSRHSGILLAVKNFRWSQESEKLRAIYHDLLSFELQK